MTKAREESSVSRTGRRGPRSHARVDRSRGPYRRSAPGRSRRRQPHCASSSPQERRDRQSNTSPLRLWAYSSRLRPQSSDCVERDVTATTSSGAARSRSSPGASLGKTITSGSHTVRGPICQPHSESTSCPGGTASWSRRPGGPQSGRGGGSAGSPTGLRRSTRHGGYRPIPRSRHRTWGGTGTAAPAPTSDGGLCRCDLGRTHEFRLRAPPRPEG